LIVMAAVAIATPAVAQEVGHLIPYDDPSDEPFSVINVTLPGPVAPPLEAPIVATPLAQQVDLLNELPATADTGQNHPVNALGGGAIVSGRSGGRGTSSMQQARRSLKQLIRQLG
jgi:hypothetical protein